MYIMKNRILLITAFFILSVNCLHAEKLATLLTGKIITNNSAAIQVLLKESDGIILDMSDLSATGVYKLDLTIMDTPSRSEVEKLILEVKNKPNLKKIFYIKQYLKIFEDTVLLKPIILK